MTHPQSEPTAKTSGRKRDPHGTRDRLVRAALELFTTQGYHASTTPEIAARAGVAEGTIYRHFASKEQLLNEIYRAGVRVFVTLVREQPAALPCAERLQRVAAGWRDVAIKNPALVRLVFVSRIRTLLDARSRDAAKELRGEIEGRVIAPDVSDSGRKPLQQIPRESKDLVAGARNRKLQRDEYTGSTFSVGSLGMMGIDEFSAVINPPERAILAVGAVVEKPVVADGRIEIGYRCRMTLSCDHRVVDGATCAKFLQSLQRILENPVYLAF